MKSTLMSLQGVNVLSKAQQKQIKGSGPCGVKVNGVWMQTVDTNGSGTTKEETMAMMDDGQAYMNGQYYPVQGWCCDSCPWN